MHGWQRALAAAAGTVAILAVGAGPAFGATATVKNDAGTPVNLSPGAPLTIRNMELETVVMVADTEGGSFKTHVNSPAGEFIGSDLCKDTDSVAGVTQGNYFRGNGTYTVVVQIYSDHACATPRGAPINFQYVVASSVTLAPPAGVLQTRPAGSFTTNQQQIGFAGNPGATAYEVRYALNGQTGPDGGLMGASQTAFADPATGRISLSLDTPGTYVMVARASRGGVFSPWTPPLILKVVAPFDLSSLDFPDSRGPSYSLRGQIREHSATGRVTVAIARGKHGRRFRPLGSARIHGGGKFNMRFRIRRLGWYRLRFSYRGSATVVSGRQFESIQIRRRIFG